MSLREIKVCDVNACDRVADGAPCTICKLDCCSSHRSELHAHISIAGRPIMTTIRVALICKTCSDSLYNTNVFKYATDKELANSLGENLIKAFGADIAAARLK